MKLLAYLNIAALAIAPLHMPAQDFTFAWLSDVHLDSFAYAEEDLRNAIEDINANESVEFTIISGDATEFGDTKEFVHLKEILSGFTKPFFILPGNHDVNWSENGCSVFDKMFGASHFCFDWKGVRFVGCGAGPGLRMGPPYIPKEEILWLDSVYRTIPERQPVIFVNHFPLNSDLSNCAEVLHILKTKNTQAALAGHLHVNRNYDADGIPGAIGRSSLRRKDPAGGYNLVKFRNDTLFFHERIIKGDTRPVWKSIAFSPAVRTEWKIKDDADIASQGAIDGHLYIYANTAGVVKALDVTDGEQLWRYKTGNRIFSTPLITLHSVIVSSTDGYIYALDKRSGEMLWKFDTGYPTVASPAVRDTAVYIGSSNGKFYSLNLENGKPYWICEGLKGFIEARPAVDEERIYIGTWGAMFYAIERSTGRKIWEFDTGRGRYFSPGACRPLVLPCRDKEQIVVLSSDYFLRSFEPSTGKLLWESNHAKGRESLGVSADRKRIYIKGIDKNITAADISQGAYTPLWSIEMPYESDFVPTPLVSARQYIFIPTGSGTVYAVDPDGYGISWRRRISDTAVTSLVEANDGRVIAMTMDGTIACMNYLY